MNHTTNFGPEISEHFQDTWWYDSCGGQIYIFLIFEAFGGVL